MIGSMAERRRSSRLPLSGLESQKASRKIQIHASTSKEPSSEVTVKDYAAPWRSLGQPLA